MSSPPVELPRMVYGSVPGVGYRVKALSPGLPVGAVRRVLEGHYTPLRGGALLEGSESGETWMLHPLNMDRALLLSRIAGGPDDEIGRQTFTNHSTVVPVDLVRAGRLSLVGVAQALREVEDRPGLPGTGLPPLSVVPQVAVGDEASSYRALLQHMTSASVETLLAQLMSESEGRVLVLVRESSAGERAEILFRLAEVLIQSRLPSITSISDAPTASVLNHFRLVVAARGVRADHSWRYVETTLAEPALSPPRGLEGPLERLRAIVASSGVP